MTIAVRSEIAIAMDARRTLASEGITVTVVSGTCDDAPASAAIHFRAFATSARPRCPTIATLVGGPMTLFSMERLAVIRGSSG